MYFTTEYPSVSHTFIRREVLGLETEGFRVVRAALRRGSYIIDPIDHQETARTAYILEGSRAMLLWNVLCGLRAVKLSFLSGMRRSLRLNKHSSRGLARHLAYVVEALALHNLARKQNVSHIHVHFGTNAATVAYLCQLMGGPSFSMTVHGPDEFDDPMGFALGEKVRASVFTVAISDFCKAQLMRWSDVSSWHKIHRIGCTVEDYWFERDQQKNDYSGPFVCIGRFNSQKGQLFLIKAVSKALAKGFQRKLLLIGDGELRSDIEATIRQLGLSQTVELAGWHGREEIRNFLSTAVSLVVPSFAEGLPVVIMEAMALKRPILATRIMGIPELVRDGVEGLLVTPGNESELVDALLEMQYFDDLTLRQLGENAERRVRDRHSQRAEIPRIAALFKTHLQSCPLGSQRTRATQNQDVK